MNIAAQNILISNIKIFHLDFMCAVQFEQCTIPC
jgi:hypothetical protein